jgi:hypothetical protein
MAGRGEWEDERWTDTTLCGHFRAGDVFTPFSAATAGGGDRFVIHVIGGLETLAAEELEGIEGISEVLLLQGKVLFASSAPLETLRCLRSAERLSLLCWAAPTPPMPGEESSHPSLPPEEPEAAFAPKPESAEEFAKFYSELGDRTASWLRGLEAALRAFALPALQAQERTWRAVTQHGHSRKIAFRADVNRGGKRTSNCGVTSLLMEQMLGGLCCHHLGWRVDLRHWDVDVSLHWNEAQVVLELPVFFTRSRWGARKNNQYLAGVSRPIGGERRMGERDFLSHGALSGAVSWAIARLARIDSPCTILDPCVGRGGLLIEAALSHPRCKCIGLDNDLHQLAAAASSLKEAACEA